MLSVRIDRHFPHTLRLVVTPERPVLLLRRGKEGWVVSARGRVLRKVDEHAAELAPAGLGRQGRRGEGRRAARARERRAPRPPRSRRSPASTFPAHVRAVRATETELTLVLRSGLELRLGERRATCA